MREGRRRSRSASPLGFLSTSTGYWRLTPTAPARCAIPHGCTDATYRVRVHLRSEEPQAPGFAAVRYDDLARRLGLTPGVRALVLVDGRSGSGKSTFAARLAAAVGAHVVHTDDVAWHLHPIDWTRELVTGVLTPWRRGGAVDYRPPGWIAKGREGSVQVPAGTEMLIVEGVGAGREELAALADVVVWVQSDGTEARRRAIVRDMDVEGRTRQEAEDFWDEWARSEDPFLADDRPWSRAGLVALGTPGVDGGPIPPADTALVTPGPLR